MTSEEDDFFTYRLLMLSSKGDLEGLQSLFNHNSNIDVNKRDYDNRTALHLAVEEGHEDVVRFLLSKGASVSIPDRWGTTVLRIALRNNHQKIAILLREHGASLKIDEVFTLEEIEKANGNVSEKVERIRLLFENLDTEKKGEFSIQNLQKFLAKSGLFLEDFPVLQREVETLLNGNENIKWKNFLEMMMGPPSLIQKAFKNKLAIRNWEEFCTILTELFNEVKKNNDGEVATYIPELGNADPEWFGVSVCTVDGQRFNIGEYEREFPIESCGKPMMYSMVIEERGYDFVHQFVGKEPSGAAFNAFTLNYENKPHNACINAGAMAICALYKPHESKSRKFKLMQNTMQEYAGGMKVGFNQAVYLSEKDTAHTNFALLHFMASKGSFPTEVSLQEAIDFYFQLCSLNINCKTLATIAATYANYGICPTTQKRVMCYQTVKRTMQLLFSCGMYDFSGEWACTVGLSAKSGVSGSIFLVVPNICGLCIYSPKLDRNGNSVRAIEFATKLAERMCWSTFDVIFKDQNENKQKF